MSARRFAAALAFSTTALCAPGALADEAVPELTSPPSSAESATTQAAAPAPKKRFSPTIELGLGGLGEALDVRVPGVSSEQTRSDVRMTFALGLTHPVARLSLPQARIDGHASIGIGPTFQRGDYQIPLRENVTLAWDAAPWLTLRGGLGLGFTIDASRSAFSQAEVGLPLGVTFFDTIEIAYRPYLALPLGSEERDVFGGSRTLSAATAFQPLDIALRFRWTAIGF